MATKKITKIISTENGDNYVADIEAIENRITQNSSNLETAKQELSNKCNEALNEAKAYTDNNNFFKSDGSSPLTPTPNAGNASLICLNRDDSCIRIFGGTPFGGSQYEVGGQLILNGKDRSEQITDGQLVALRANAIKDGAHTVYDLQISKDGRLTFKGRDVIRYVNGVTADANGNAVVISHTIQNTNNFASTFLCNNNALKIQCVRISGDQGQQYGTVNWLLPFADTNYHVFVTSEDTDVNLAFQFASVSLIGKTTTSCKVGHKVETTGQFYTRGFISVVGIGF